MPQNADFPQNKVDYPPDQSRFSVKNRFQRTEIKGYKLTKRDLFKNLI